MNRPSLTVIGIGHEGPSGLSTAARTHLEAAHVLAGGRRQLDFYPHWRGEKVLLGSDVPAFVGVVRAKYQQAKTVVLASGDPLFYGIGRALLEAIPKDDLLFLPAISSIQLAFARIKETWNDAHVVSLHGRSQDALIAAVRAREPKIAVLTDAKNHPAELADLLRRLNAGADYEMWVCENLGGPDEQISRHVPNHMQGAAFSPLNVVVLLRRTVADDEGDSDLPLLGIPEAVLLNEADPRGMITRREVRLLALCYLELRPGNVLWDIGAGTGSVSLEAVRLSRQLEVMAIERDARAYLRLEANVARLGQGQVRALCAEAPEGLTELPAPDAVFIGGSGGRLTDILLAVTQRLKAGGRIVLNCITLENFTRGWEKLRDLGMNPEATSVQLAHSRPLGRLHSLEPEYPIFILRARKR